MGRPVAIAGLLLPLLAYLMFQSRSSGQAPRVRMQRALHAVQLHNARLNRDVLRARAGLLANYDSLAESRRDLIADLEKAPDPDTKKEAEAALAGMPDTPLAVHGRLIVRTLPRVDAQLRAVVASPAGNAAATLQRAVIEYGTRAEARAQRFRPRGRQPGHRRRHAGASPGRL